MGWVHCWQPGVKAVCSLPDPLSVPSDGRQLPEGPGGICCRGLFQPSRAHSGGQRCCRSRHQRLPSAVGGSAALTVRKAKVCTFIGCPPSPPLYPPYHHHHHPCVVCISSAGRCHVPAWERRIVCCSAAPPHPHSLCGWRGGRCLPFQPCWVGFSPLVLGQGLKWPLPVPSVTHSLLFCPPRCCCGGAEFPLLSIPATLRSRCSPGGGLCVPSLCSGTPGGWLCSWGAVWGTPPPLFPAPSPWWCGAEPTLKGGGGYAVPGSRGASFPCSPSLCSAMGQHHPPHPPPPPRPLLLRVL